MRTEFTEVISGKSCFCGKVKVKSLSCVRLFATPGTVAYKFPPSMEFSRQEYWSGFHFLLQGQKKIFATQGVKPGSPTLQADAFTFYRLSQGEANAWLDLIQDRKRGEDQETTSINSSGEFCCEGWRRKG